MLWNLLIEKPVIFFLGGNGKNKVDNSFVRGYYIKLMVKFATGWYSWFKYLLEPINSKYVSRWEVIKCRATGHKYGVIWYSNALDPDMHCMNCGDDLG